jgi:hypothetical protein
VQHSITLHDTTSSYIALHYSSLQYSTVAVTSFVPPPSRAASHCMTLKSQ